MPDNVTIEVVVPDAFLSLLKIREGYSDVSYKDTKGRLTAGVGHLLSSEEMKQYPLGTTIPEATLKAWELRDTLKAYKAAEQQAFLIGTDNPILTNALASVCFQLGASWNEEFVHTWRLLRAHNWTAAANEVEKSLWFKQTPVRVKDFQKALRSLA